MYLFYICLIKSGKALILLENSRQILAEKSPTSDWYGLLLKARTYFKKNFWFFAGRNPPQTPLPPRPFKKTKELKISFLPSLKLRQTDKIGSDLVK